MFSRLSDDIEQIIRQRPYCEDTLRSYDALLSLMSSEEPELPDVIPENRLQKVKVAEGFPLFQREDLPVDSGSGGVVFLKFLEHFRYSEEREEKKFEKAMTVFREDPALLQSLFNAVLKDDREALGAISDRTGLERERLDFLATTALKPSLYALRAAFSRQLDKTVWNRGYCPFCGSGPDMAYLDKTGKRHLHCAFCGEEWPYPRLNCPFCRNDDHTSLGYFHSDEEEGFRVDFCRKCERYIKTVDRRVLESETPMELENLASLHLDIIANKEGFK
jgi:FdhE protein